MQDPDWRATLIGGPEKRRIELAEYDPSWPQKFARCARSIRAALGSAALGIEHIGSTSVPGLAAKPIIDILVVVEDSSDEPAYARLMESAGYVLRVREPEWHQHRMFRSPEQDVHVHVYSAGCPEIGRILLFRERLRHHAGDRTRYERRKRDLAAQAWPDMNAYAEAKTGIVEEIMAAAIRDQPGN